MKPTKRKAFNFLRSYFDVLNKLENDKDRLEFLTSIINKQFLNEDPKGLGFIANLCYESQRHQIESSVKGWERASKEPLSTTPPTTPPATLSTAKQEEEGQGEVEEKEKEEDKVQLTILNRESDFKNSLQPFLEQYGKDLLNDFYLYWTEKKPKGKKMLFELQKTFDIERRLARWSKNNFNNKNNGISNKQQPTLTEAYDKFMSVANSGIVDGSET